MISLLPPHLRAATVTLAALAALAAGAAGCGGKSKAKTTPESTGTVTTEDTGRMKNTDPSGVSSSLASSPDSDAAGDAGDGDTAGAKKDKPPGDDSAAAAPPPIVPPDLDLPAADQQARVQTHLANARAALRGRAREPDRALSQARAALRADAGNIDAVVLMAHAYHAKDLDDTAEVVLDMVYKEREASRKNPGLYHVYGLIYDATGRPERAFLAYRRAVELDPDHRSALINLGAHSLKNRKFADAVRIYERLTRDLGAKSAAIWTNLASAYRGHAGDYPARSPRRDELLRQAETTYRRALNADRGYANAYYNLGLLYLDAGAFPGPGGPMDTLERLKRAKTYFDEYRGTRGADMDLVAGRLKQVDKLIKRETKRRKRAKSGDDW